MYMIKKLKTTGFSLIEILFVMSIIAILVVGYTYVAARSGKEKAYFTRAISELSVISNAIKLQVQENNIYPDDVSRGLPAGIEKYIATPNDEWPNAPWPGTVYDYENWDSGQVIQVSARFCLQGQNSICKDNATRYLKQLVKTCSTDTQTCLSQNDLDNWDASSSVYICIKENLSSSTAQCRSHESQSITHPGLRIDASTAR